MVQTKGGVSSNPWVDYVRKCAKEYKSSKEQAKEQAKDTKSTNGGKGAKHAKGTASKEEAEVRKWKDRQEEVYRKQSHANMKRSGEIAQKAEREQLTRKRLTTKQKDPNVKRSGDVAKKAKQEHSKRLTSKQKDPNSSI